MQFGTGNQKNNVFCLLIRQSFVIFVKMKTADGTLLYDINEIVYQTFNEEGIGFPFPQLTVHQSKE